MRSFQWFIRVPEGTSHVQGEASSMTSQFARHSTKSAAPKPPKSRLKPTKNSGFERGRRAPVAATTSSPLLLLLRRTVTVLKGPKVKEKELRNAGRRLASMLGFNLGFNCFDMSF